MSSHYIVRFHNYQTLKSRKESPGPTVQEVHPTCHPSSHKCLFIWHIWALICPRIIRVSHRALVSGLPCRAGRRQISRGKKVEHGRQNARNCLIINTFLMSRSLIIPYSRTLRRSLYLFELLSGRFTVNQEQLMEKEHTEGYNINISLSKN